MLLHIAGQPEDGGHDENSKCCSEHGRSLTNRVPNIKIIWPVAGFGFVQLLKRLVGVRFVRPFHFVAPSQLLHALPDDAPEHP